MYSFSHETSVHVIAKLLFKFKFKNAFNVYVTDCTLNERQVQLVVRSLDFKGQRPFMHDIHKCKVLHAH